MHNNVITSILNQINHSSNCNSQSLTADEYETWKRESIMDGLRGVRFGQSFCNHFAVTDYILFYTRDTNRCDKHIKQYYVKS